MARIKTSIALDKEVQHALRVFCSSRDISQADFVNKVLMKAIADELTPEEFKAIKVLEKGTVSNNALQK